MGNDRIDLFYMIGFASGANVSLVAKNGTKKNILLLSIKSSKKPQIKKFHKTDPPKVRILIKNTILKFSKTKNETQKRPSKVPKKSKAYIRRPQIKKFYKTDPTKSGNFDSKCNFKILKTKNQTQKDPLMFQNIKNIYKEASNQKVL